MTRTLLLMALCLTTPCAFSQRIVVYLDNTPASTPSVTKAPLRYDKEFAYSVTFDDGSADAFTCGLPAFQGGLVVGNGTTYSALNYTDGCGNTLPFRGGIAWNAANALGIDNHTGNVAGMMTWKQLDSLYDKGWDVFNHSYTHNARWLGAMTATDYANEVNRNIPVTRDKTRNRIEMPAFVVPSGDNYYQDIAYAQGHKIVFDQTANTIGVGGLSVGNSIPQIGQVIHRGEIDQQVNTGGNQIGIVANRAAAGERIWYNEFTHRVSNFGASAGLPFANFRTHVERIANKWGKTGSDKMWMAPLQEVLEYLTTRETATYTTSLNGNQLTIDFNTQNVPSWLRRRPLTLVVNSSVTFSRVEVPQGVQMTFNGTGSKKIINLDFSDASAVSNNSCTTDSIPPVFANCPQNINLTTSGVGSVATWTAPTASDNCSTPSVISNYTSGATFPIGSTKVTYTATDAKNNRSTCNFNIVVTQAVNNSCDNDVIPPVFSNCPQNISLTTTNLGAFVTWTPPTATDNCSTPTLSSDNSSGLVYPIGTTTVIYTATDAKNNTSTCNFNIIVTLTTNNPCDNDTTRPVLLNCPQNINLTTTGIGAVATWTAPTASDNCSTPSVSGTYTSGATFPLGTMTVKYTATDAKNNRSTCSFNVTVSQIGASLCANDVTPPVFKNCDQTVNATTPNYSAVVTWTPPTATDDCATTPVLSSNYPNGSTFPVGTTAIIYAATDDKFNRSTCSFNVIVMRVTGTCINDATPPVFKNCPSNINQTTPSTVSYAAWTAPTATDDCTSNPTITSNFASGQYFPLGITTVTYVATDAKGNRSTCSFNIVVQSSVIGEICTSKADTPWQEWVSKVQFNTLVNQSEKTRIERYLIGYSDFRDISTTVTTNKSYPLSITASESYSSGTAALYYRAWIDFNGNGFFEATEKVLEKTNNGKSVATQTVTIPSTATIGTVRMRVSMKKGSYAAPCENYAYGEVEDYSVVITAANLNPPIVNLVQRRPTQLIPIVINKIAPNPTEGDVFIKVESLDKRLVKFEFYNAMGMLVKSENQEVEKGVNTLGFDFSKAPQGVYFIQTDVGKGREVPVKFVKM
jgi:hypothetical protein